MTPQSNYLWRTMGLDAKFRRKGQTKNKRIYDARKAGDLCKSLDTNAQTPRGMSSETIKPPEGALLNSKRAASP